LSTAPLANSDAESDCFRGFGERLRVALASTLSSSSSSDSVLSVSSGSGGRRGRPGDRPVGGREGVFLGDLISEAMRRRGGVFISITGCSVGSVIIDSKTASFSWYRVENASIIEK
jgi:hypothetical protein